MQHRRVLGMIALSAVLAAVAGKGLVVRQPDAALPPTVLIAAGPQIYRPAGEYRLGTSVVDAPVEMRDAAPIEIMTGLVSEADYAACVADRACAPVPTGAASDRPQTQVNHADATAYAVWLSARTGVTWRLPSDAEWLRAAGDRAVDDALADAGDDPASRWIASYEREVALRGEADPDLHPAGYFGLNDRGLADIAGNVWEWTETCFHNGTLTPDGSAIAGRSDYCGVRAVQGKHRAFVIDFVRDARVGGCAAGVPPDYLGFRLVRDGQG